MTPLAHLCYTLAHAQLELDGMLWGGSPNGRHLNELRGEVERLTARVAKLDAENQKKSLDTATEVC